MKIGFLAMSGLRAHDPELLKLGLTLPGVLERGKVLSSLPSLGLLYLAACTPPGHELRYFEAEGEGKEPAEVFDCDLVAINTFSAQVFEAYAVADRLRIGGLAERWTVLVAAATFSLLHAPNAGLMLATFAGGLIWSALWLRERSLLALGASHALAALVLTSALPPAWLRPGRYRSMPARCACLARPGKIPGIAGVRTARPLHCPGATTWSPAPVR